MFIEKNNRGFTALEMLLVLGLIVLLLGGVVMIGFRDQAPKNRNAERRNEVNAIANALATWSLDNNTPFGAISPAFLASPTCIGTKSKTLTVIEHTSDPVLQNIIVAAEGKIGGSTTYELGIGPTISSPAHTADYTWNSGWGGSFVFQYDKATNRMILATGDPMITYYPSSFFNANSNIYIKIFANSSAGTTNSSIEMYNLVLNEQTITNTSKVDYPPGNEIEVLEIGGIDLTNSFRLTGKAKMTWGGTKPTGSNLSYQIIVADAQNPIVECYNLLSQLKPTYFENIPEDPKSTNGQVDTGYTIYKDAATKEIIIGAPMAENGEVIEARRK